MASVGVITPLGATLVNRVARRVIPEMRVGLIHYAPREVWRRYGLDNVLWIFLQTVAFVTRRLEPNVHFDVGTFDVHIRPLESIRYPSFCRKDNKQVFSSHARFNLANLPQDLRYPLRSLLREG